MEPRECELRSWARGEKEPAQHLERAQEVQARGCQISYRAVKYSTGNTVNNIRVNQYGVSPVKVWSHYIVHPKQI